MVPYLSATMDHVELARMGGKARAAALTARQRIQAARKAVNERWKKYRQRHPDKRKAKRKAA
jgi:hypothetical protein